MLERNSLYRGRMPAKYFFSRISLALSSLVSKPGAVQHLHQALRRIVPRSQAERTDRRIHAVRPRFDRLHQAHQRDSRRRMHVNVNADVLPAGFLDALHDVEGRLRLEQRRHVLDADRIAAQVEKLLRHFHEVAGRVQRAHRVADRSLRVLARTPHGRDRAPQIPYVVQRVEHAENVHPVLRRLVHETVHHRILVVAIPQQVLAAQQHLQPAVRQQLAELPQPLPGILVQEAYAGVERRASPTLHRPVPRLVDIRAGGNHVFHSHPRRHQALVGVAKDEFGYINCLRHIGFRFLPASRSIGFPA